jgi:hypothetical protein
MQARILITLWYDQTLPKAIEPIPPNWARAVGIYSQLFKYTLQVLKKTTMGPAPPNVHTVYSPLENKIMCSYDCFYNFAFIC